MPFTNEEIHTSVIECLQAMATGNDWPTITVDISPIDDLALESVDGLEFCLELEDRLGCRIDEKYNPFLDDETGRSRSVEQIIEWIEAHAEACKAETNHE